MKKTKMVHLSYWFRCLLLLGLFFVVLMHDLGDHSSAYAHRGKGIKEEEHGSVGEKELVEGGKIRGGGRKAVIGRALGHDMKSYKEVSTISTGANHCDGKCEDGVGNIGDLKDVKWSKKLNHEQEKKTLGKIQYQEYFDLQKKSMLSSGKGASRVKNENDESEDDNDEERRELVSLMRRDYSGLGRRKPPINNREPRH